MKKNLTNQIVILTLFMVCIVNPGLRAQSGNISTRTGTMKLSGTSTFHNWCMNGTFQVDGNFKTVDGTNKLKALNVLNFLLPVQNLKSDKKRLDETAYKALKTDQFKDILFNMISASIREVQGNKYSITALGNLTIAGVTKPISLEVTWIMNDDHTITCSGIQKLKMTDYEVQPPSFLAIMKTGDEITLDFTFQFKS